MLGTESAQTHLTAAESFCRSSREPGSIYHLLSPHRREIFPDAKFAHPYPSGTGRLSIPTSRMASVFGHVHGRGVLSRAVAGLEEVLAERRPPCDPS
jgi:hypothetical protein